MYTGMSMGKWVYVAIMYRSCVQCPMSYIVRLVDTTDKWAFWPMAVCRMVLGFGRLRFERYSLGPDLPHNTQYALTHNSTSNELPVLCSDEHWLRQLMVLEQKQPMACTIWLSLLIVVWKYESLEVVTHCQYAQLQCKSSCDCTFTG
jgi:hypothetical protein